MKAIYLVTVNCAYEGGYTDRVYARKCSAARRVTILNKKSRHPEMEWAEVEKHFVIGT